MHRTLPRTTRSRASTTARCALGRAPGPLTALALVGATVVGAAACKGSVETRTIGPITLALSDATPVAKVPAAGGAGGAGGAGLFETQASVVLPLTQRPADGAAASKPYPRAIWYGASDLQVQVTYTISNLSDDAVIFELLVDPWNEFIRYTPQVSVDEEGRISADASPIDRRIILDPRARISGTVSYDDFYRMALDLAVIMNGSPNPFHVIEPHTKILTDPQTSYLIPSQIDGLTGFDLSLRSSSKAKLALEATVELIDHGGYLVAEGTTSNASPPAERYTPKIAAATP
ncbi:MAG: hypothetical protein NVS3B10_31090 [Polyangiales bacterium]